MNDLKNEGVYLSDWQQPKKYPLLVWVEGNRLDLLLK